MNRFAIIGSTLLIAGALAGCSSDASSSDTSPPGQGQSSTPSAASSSMSAMPGMPSSHAMSTSPSATTAAAATITIKDFKFTVTGKITPGAKIMVRNEDGEAHTVTADKGAAFDVNAPASKTVTLTAPTKPGAYPFHCNFHSNMHGSFTVR